jgi:hypothetical protein
MPHGRSKPMENDHKFRPCRGCALNRGGCKAFATVILHGRFLLAPASWNALSECAQSDWPGWLQTHVQFNSGSNPGNSYKCKCSPSIPFTCIIKTTAKSA